jgi:hypothetical protein
VAFLVEQFITPNQARDDPNYIPWWLRLKSGIKDVTKTRNLTYHKCTDADYNSFNPKKICAGDF